MQHYMEVNDWKTALNKRKKQRIVLQSPNASKLEGKPDYPYGGKPFERGRLF